MVTEAEHPVRALIGGPRGALEGMLPPIVFVVAYIATSSNLGVAALSALAVGIFLAVLRIVRGEKPVRVLGALVVVIIAATVAYITGDATAYFWPLVAANLASALIFAGSIVIRWPLMGVFVGPLVGTRMRWREDPALVRAYSIATWPWVILNIVRGVVQIPLIQGQELWALAAIRPVFYGLVVLTVMWAWWLVKRNLPPDHPGVRFVVSSRSTTDASTSD